MIKRKFIYGLISFSLLLIAANIYIDNFFTKSEPVIREISKTEIENGFTKTLIDHGIDDEWIEKKNVERNNADSINYIYRVKIPSDISITSIIKDLNETFINKPLLIESTERKNYSNSTVKFYSNEILKLEAYLNHEDNISRKYATYSFIVNVDNIEINEILKIQIPFSLAITPSETNAKQISRLNELNKSYVILLDDTIDDSKYKLDKDFSKEKLIRSIKSILFSFGRNRVYIIDDNSSIYNSKIYNLLKDELVKRNIKIIIKNSLTNLTADSNKELFSLFEFYTTSLKKKEGKIFLMNYNNFITLQAPLEKQIKKGDRIILPQFN